MIKLIRACMRRYAHNRLFWITAVLTLAIGTIIACKAKYCFYDDAMVIVQMLMHAVMISWIVGKEYKEGIFRNKIIAGHSKGNIFLAELLSASVVASVLYFLCALIFVLFNFYEVPLLPSSLLIRIFVDYVLLNICLTAIFVTIACLFSQQAVITVINILFVLLMVVVSQRFYGELSQPQYLERYETINSEWIDENGNIRYRSVKVEGSEYYVENPTYVGGIKRDLREFVYHLSPYAHIIDFADFNMDWHGYDYFMENPAEGMSGEETWQMVIGDNEITAETMNNFSTNLIYSCLLMIATGSAGYIGFRRKEFK